MSLAVTPSVPAQTPGLQNWRWFLAAALILVSFALPLGIQTAGTPLIMIQVAFFLIAAFLAAVGWTGRLDGARLALVLALVAIGVLLLLYTVHRPEVAGHVRLGLWGGPGPWADAPALPFWLKVAALWLAASLALDALAEAHFPAPARQRLAGAAVPLLFGGFAFALWEWIVVGFGVPGIIMPAPSGIVTALAASLPMLGADFTETVLKSVIPGWALGCLIGFAVAIAADRVPFLRRGLLPLGNVVSALPIIGVAPIMVMWFGFGWESKVAVVVTMTVFPMLVNTVTGLSAAGPLERDLMRSYGAGYWKTLFALRLPAAMPFIFNALKVNSTLALIGAIVAEFFGSPIVGMGFRISTEVGRLALATVWAEIVVAALSGSLFYAVIAAVERWVTFWHPSYRRA